VALEKQADAATAADPFYKAKLGTARFYFAKLLPETASLIRTARAGAAPMRNATSAVRTCSASG
jgi:hypothetical protein